MAARPFTGTLDPPTDAQPKVRPFTGTLDTPVQSAKENVPYPIGLGETALSMATGSLAQPVAGLAGLAMLPAGLEESGKTVEKLSKSLTYEPKTQIGKLASHAVAWPFQKLKQGAEKVGEAVLSATGSPTAAAIADTSIQALPMLMPQTPKLLNIPLGRAERFADVMRDYGTLVNPVHAPRLVRRKLQELVGEAELPGVIKTLEQTKELTKGSKPTVGQAVAKTPQGSPLIAYQETVAKLPSVSPRFAQRWMEQQGVRESALKGIAGDPAALKAYTEFRDALGKELYGKAGELTVHTDKMFKTLMKRPAMQRAFGRARDLAKEQGTTFPKVGAKTYHVNDLHTVKMALDDLVKDPQTFGIGANEARAMMGTRAAFLQWIEKKADAYRMARETYKAASVPMNQMHVGQQLQGKLSSVSGSETPGAFLRAIKDEAKTVKKSTGQPREFEDIFTPMQVETLEGIAADLERDLAMKKPAQRTTIGSDLGGQELVANLFPEFLYRPITSARWLSEILAKRMEPKLSEAAANVMLNPDYAAYTLKKPYVTKTRPEYQDLANRALGQSIVQGQMQPANQ